ncbi:hypothetical protein AHAS_Ahas06G0153800 [Arachis hypogaea]
MENMNVNEFNAHHDKYQNKYIKRVIKLCRKLQVLDQPHAQDAFDLDNRIWDQDEVMFPIEEEQVQEKEKDKEKDKHKEDDLLNRCPFLRGTFRFGSGVGRIPMMSERAVESAVGCLGESAVQRWDDKWKNLQIQEMQNYLAND